MRLAAEELVRDPGAVQDRWSWTPGTDHSLHELLQASGGRAFETSGSGTGVPSTWWRSPDQLAQEAAVTVAALPDGIDSVVTTVAPTSLYGFALGVLTPIELRVPVRHCPVLLRDLDLEPGHTLVVTIAPGWTTGPVLPPPPPGCTVTFVHAGSMLPPRARTLVDAHEAVTLMELFGSTETGLLATRTHTAGSRNDSDPWTVVDDVLILSTDSPTGNEVPLSVRSPRIGSALPTDEPPERHTLGDWVTPISEREFCFHGRRERVTKADGRRVDLDLLEAQIGKLTDFQLSVACLPALDPVGGEVVVLEVEGDDAVARELELLLRRCAPTLPVRPRVVAVDQILRSPMGKPRPLRPAA